jgi:hypothetical protein
MLEYKPVIYLAGKIAPHDWRWKLLGKAVVLYTDDEDKLFDPHYLVDCGSFRYGGPYYVACDHRCGYGPANHGVGASGKAGCLVEWADTSPNFSAPRRVFDVNRNRIKFADIVFAYINSVDCYGTLIELGMASARGMPIYLTFGEDLSFKQLRDLWMTSQCATDFHTYPQRPVEEAWAEFLLSLAQSRHMAPLSISLAAE